MPLKSSYILVVDDDPAITDQIAEYFQNQGYKFQTFNSALDAIDALRKIAFDFIIADLHMPYINGNEFVRLVRSLPEYKHTPLIVISQRGGEADLIESLNCGADDFIRKPLNETLFISKIKANFNKIAFKRDFYQKNIINHLTTEQGVVFYLSDNPKEFYNNWDLTFKLKPIKDLRHFEESSELYNCWAIIIDSSCRWAMDSIEKINSDMTEQPVIFMIGDFMPHIAYENIFFLSPQKPFSEHTEYIEFILKRERHLKRKYINAMQLAAEKTPFVSQRFVNQKHGSFSISAYHEPLDKVPGGDFYEIFKIGKGKSFIFLGDVMGKNWDAWFYVPAYLAYVRSAIKMLITGKQIEDIRAGEVLHFLNSALVKDLTLGGVFSTLTCLIIDSNSNSIQLALAGGTPPVFYNAEKECIENKKAKGLILGLREHSEYETLDINFSPRSKMLLYTDGYSEASSSLTEGIIKMQGVEDSFFANIKEEQLSALQFEDDLINRFNIKKFDDDRTAILISHE